MKLIYCPKCHDIVALMIVEVRHCLCGRSRGHYLDDGIEAVIEGEAIPLGIATASFHKALNNRPESGQGEEFTAFVIPEKCDTITKRYKSIYD